MKSKPAGDMPKIADEPGWQDRFERGLQRALTMPHKPHAPKPKERAAGKGRVHKGKART